MPYLMARLFFRSLSGAIRQIAPALNDGVAGHLLDLLLEHSQQFFHSVHNQLVQSADNQIVNETDEAVWLRERVCLLNNVIDLYS